MTPAVVAKLSFHSIPTAVAQASRSASRCGWRTPTVTWSPRVSAPQTRSPSPAHRSAVPGVCWWPPTAAWPHSADAPSPRRVASDWWPPTPVRGGQGWRRPRPTVSVSAATPSKLAFLTSPSTVTAGTSVPFTVQIEDAYGNRVTSGAGSHDTVTISGATCSSNTTGATAGQAVFSHASFPRRQACTR